MIDFIKAIPHILLITSPIAAVLAIFFAHTHLTDTAQTITIVSSTIFIFSVVLFGVFSTGIAMLRDGASSNQ
jgi:small-conductance mechanosensitive channel